MTCHVLGVQPFQMHCVQVGGSGNPTFQTWPQKTTSICIGRQGPMLGGAANEADNRSDNNAGIVKIPKSKSLPNGATALRSLIDIDQGEEVLVDYGDGGKWKHRSPTTRGRTATGGGTRTDSPERSAGAKRGTS